MPAREPSSVECPLGCGARLGVTCSPCKTNLPPGSRFCSKCGTAVTTETAAPREPSPESYTPSIAKKILTSKGALEGERKQVTVLFADLNSFVPVASDCFLVEHRRRDRPRHLPQPRRAGVTEQIETTAAVAGDGAALANVELGPLAVELRFGDVPPALQAR